jgi:DNA-binding IclR family transcriptional regulator
MSKELIEISPPPGVGLVQKTLQILDLFQSVAPDWSQGEIAQTTGMPRSTVNRLVKFLTDRGYLSLLEGRNRYSLGPASIDLGRRASAQFDFRGICRPVLEQLSQKTRETVILTSVVAASNGVRCVDQIESTREGLRVFEQIGNIFPLHAGASPKAVLAVLEVEEQERYLSRELAKVTEQTVTDADTLRFEIAETSARGYAVSNGETYEGVFGIAAAFFWGPDRPAGSLAIALPSQRATADAVQDIGELLIAACADLDACLSTKQPAAETRNAS